MFKRFQQWMTSKGDLTPHPLVQKTMKVLFNSITALILFAFLSFIVIETIAEIIYWTELD